MFEEFNKNATKLNSKKALKNNGSGSGTTNENK